jgi:CheY-like chemotaxis protein
VTKQSLLLVDGDTRSLRVLEVSLRKAGFTVTPAASVQDALDKLELHAPDLIISETTFPDGDGFDLRRRVRATPDWAEIPFIFLTAEAAIENKIRGLELGVDDYLTKPIYIKEIVTRINILLQKRQRLRFEERKDGRTRFAGRVADMPVIDVIQTIEISRKSGVIQFVGENGRQAAIYFRDGKVIDAEAGTLQSEDAVYRLLTWSEGDFEVVFRTVRRRDAITTSSQGLLMEGMRRLDEWSRLLEQLPPLTHRFEIDTPALAARLGEIPDDNNKILRLIDGKRSLLEVIDASDFGDLECLQAVSRLFFEEMLLDLDHEKPTRRVTGKPIPLVEIDAPTPIEEVASGPIPQRTSGPISSPSPADTQPISEDEVVSEEPAAEPPAPGPLMGGIRKSSLMLIDAAVAAAQAIEPGLFENEPADSTRKTADDFAAEKDTAPGIPPAQIPTTIVPPGTIPEPISEDEPSPARRRVASKPPGPPPRAQKPDDSGLRMIGSHGRDRAEASGELMPVGETAPPVPETQREIVTIMPRRVTREMAAVQPPPDAKVSDTEPAPTPRPTPAPSIEIPRTRAPSRPMSMGSGVRREEGPGAGALALIILAALLAGTAVFFWLRRPSTKTVATMDAGVTADATTIVMTPVDSDLGSFTIDAGVAPSIDAGAFTVRADAAVAPDAAVAKVPADASVPSDADVSADPLKQAKVLYQEAQDAMHKGDPAKALELADASLALHHTARGYLARALALHKLGKNDEALKAVASAQKLSPGFASVYDVKGTILWSMRRIDDAHDAYNQFLEIEQDTARAEQIRRKLEGN